MGWIIFKTINLEIFHLRLERASLVSIIGLLLGVGTAVALFSDGFNFVASRFAQILVTDGVLGQRILADVAEGKHTFAKTMTALSLLGGIYLVLFAYHAFRFAAKTVRQDQQERALLSKKVEDLENDKKRLVASSNYREQLAAAIGVRFTRVRRFYDISNFEGDSKMTEEDVFCVSGLKLHHLLRKVSSSCAKSREKPLIEVEGLPQGVTVTRRFKDVEKTRMFNIYFAPALERTNEALTLRITEEVKQHFLMYKEAIPEGWWFNEPLELIAHIVTEPIDLLELQVNFPQGYSIQREVVFSCPIRSFRVDTFGRRRTSGPRTRLDCREIARRPC